MKRTYRRTALETAGTDSVWMKAVDKDLVAQIEIVPGAEEHDMIVEHWRTQADKLKDLAEEKDKDDGNPVVIFVCGPMNRMGFVRKCDESGSCLLCDYPENAQDFESAEKACEAMDRMREFEKRHYNWDGSFYVLSMVASMKAVRLPPETAQGEIAHMRKD